MIKPLNAVQDMPFDELVALKAKLEALIAERIRVEKKALLQKLEAIRRIETRARPSTSKPSHPVKRRAKPSPKYRHPATGETWAGRGLQPKWMRKAIEAGGSQDEFLIAS